MSSTEQLNETLPLIPAGDLPSTRTYYQLEQALASKDIDEVKAELMHVWCHYQSLELTLASEDLNLQKLREGAEVLKLEDVDPFELAARVYAQAAAFGAYDTAHEVGRAHVHTRIPIDVLMREMFPELDFTPSTD